MYIFHHGGRSQRRMSAVLLASCLLTSCAFSPPSRAPPPPAAVPAPPAATVPGYRIDPTQSLLQILVFRGGKLATLGHNHVIASHDLTGTVTRGDPLTATQFDIAFSVAALTIDEPELRRQAGPDFQAEVPQNARDGTRRNLLSAAVLNAEHFAEIRLRSVDAVATQGGAFDVGVDIDIKGRTHRLRVPVEVVVAADQLSATGELAVRQSELGLTPFTALLGALAVEDRMILRFTITARRS